MSIAKLKKQVEEIDKRVAAGDTVNVTLTKGDKQAHFRVAGRKATRVSAKASVALNVGTATDHKSFSLNFTSDITDAEIIMKIKQASGFSPAAATVGQLPMVAVTRNDQRGIWILFETCSYVPDKINPEHTITALRGFEFDLASIPRIFWSIIASHELSLAAPLFHDLLYRRGGRLSVGELAPAGRVFKRVEVDDLFLELMTKAGIPSWKRRTAYLAVRAFSGFAWQA